MGNIRTRLALIGVLLLASSAAAVAAQAPNDAAIAHLNQRLNLMLKDISQKNERAEVSFAPDKSGLRTIVRIRVHPSSAAQARMDLTKSVNEYIDIHKGDCRANTTMKGMSGYLLNPIHNGVSTTYVDVPIATLLGKGNVVTSHYADGTVVNCGAI